MTAARAATAPTTASTRCPTPPSAITISTTSTPSSSTPLNAVVNATQCSRLESACCVASNSSASSCCAFSPACRRIALCSHLRPNNKRNTPTTTCASATGNESIAAPRTTTITASTPAANPVPSSAGRQPLNSPTASTIVNASTHSTPDARNVEMTTSGLSRRFRGRRCDAGRCGRSHGRRARGTACRSSAARASGCARLPRSRRALQAPRLRSTGRDPRCPRR